jgi:hypothetical protein
MTTTGAWFQALDARDRKALLAILHEARSAVATRAAHPILCELIQKLDDEHAAAKREGR